MQDSQGARFSRSAPIALVYAIKRAEVGYLYEHAIKPQIWEKYVGIPDVMTLCGRIDLGDETQRNFLKVLTESTGITRQPKAIPLGD